MRKQLIYILIILLSGFIKAQGGWKRQYFLQNTTAQVSWNVVECPNGNFISIGITQDNQYCSYLTLLGTDPQGNELWRKDYGNCRLNYIAAIKEIAEDNIFYISASLRDTNHLDMDASLLIKFNYQGDTLWQRKYSSGQSDVHLYVDNICKSVDGGILLTCFQVDLNLPPQCTVIIKTDKNGNELWRKTIHKSAPDVIRSGFVIQDSASKRIILTGYQFIGNSTVSSVLILDSLGNKLTQKSYNNANGGSFLNILQLKDKNFVTSGQWSVDFDNIIYNPLIVKFDTNSNLIWSRKLNAGYLNGIDMVCELQNGDIVGVGYADTIRYGAKKIQFIVLNSNGELKWSRYIGSLRSSPDTYINSEAATSVHRTSDKGFILSTWFYYPDINNPYSIIKLDSTGCDTLPQDCREIMTGIEKQETEENGFKVYPNPSSDKLNVYFENGTNAQETKIMLSDIYGREVKRTEIKEESTSIDVNDLPPGIYFITLMQNGKVLARQKVVIMD